MKEATILNTKKNVCESCVSELWNSLNRITCHSGWSLSELICLLNKLFIKTAGFCWKLQFVGGQQLVKIIGKNSLCHSSLQLDGGVVKLSMEELKRAYPGRTLVGNSVYVKASVLTKTGERFMSEVNPCDKTRFLRPITWYQTAWVRRCMRSRLPRPSLGFSFVPQSSLSEFFKMS